MSISCRARRNPEPTRVGHRIFRPVSKWLNELLPAKGDHRNSYRKVRNGKVEDVGCVGPEGWIHESRWETLHFVIGNHKAISWDQDGENLTLIFT